MISAAFSIGWIILLVSFSSVCGLCSTCLEQRCHDNGECIIGCVRGYVGEYCEKDCPPQCLNKVCHFHISDGAIMCTDGCEPGYCHTQCSVSCPEGCATCDRKCGSCNVTLCPERRYGANCSEVCSPRYGKCDRKTGQCIICRRGYYGDECRRKCTTCFTRAETIMDRCLSGCNICKSKEDSCRAGFHGDECELRCSSGCDHLERGCNRATGECFAGCLSGYHGLTCKSTENETSKTHEILIPVIFVSQLLIFLTVTRSIYRWCRRRRRCSQGKGEYAERKELVCIRNRIKENITLFTTGMINISTVNEVTRMLQSQDWVNITGNAGDGKTTLGYLVLKQLQPHMNVYDIEEPEEYKVLSRFKEDRVIMLDDRFGAFTSDQALVNKWKDTIKALHQQFGRTKNKTKVIFVSRKNVLNEIRDYLGHFKDTLQDAKYVVDLSERKIIEDRLEILDYYMKKSKLKISREVLNTVANLDIPHGFPHSSMLYPKLKTEKVDLDIVEFFKSPLKFLDITTVVLYNGNCQDLFELMIKNDGNVNIYSIEDDKKRKDLLKVEREQKGSYITTGDNGFCKFAHPSIYESVLSVICEKDPLFCVKYANLSVIKQKLALTSDEKNKSPTNINLKPVQPVVKVLAERFRPDILQGDYSLFSHRVCENDDFCKALMDSCVYSVNDPEQAILKKRHINENGQNGRTMLWEALLGGKRSLLKALVEIGADVNIPYEGNTPILYLCKQRNVDVESIRIVIRSADGWNCKDENGAPPLYFLCYRDKVDIETLIALVTDVKADINQSDNIGDTSLHWLCRNSSVPVDDIKKFIVTGHDDINKTGSSGFTPLHYLCSRNVTIQSIVSLVRSVGGDMNKTDLYGNTPLHYLCLTTNKSGVHALLKKVPHAKDTLKNADGFSPHDFWKGKAKESRLLVNAAVDICHSDPMFQLRDKTRKWIPVIDASMSLSQDRVHEWLQVDESGLEMTNLLSGPPRTLSQEYERIHAEEWRSQFKRFYGTCCSVINIPPSPSSHTTPSYWENDFKIKWKKEGGFIVLEIGIVEGRDNIDEGSFISDLSGSVCLSMWQYCHQHSGHICIKGLMRDQEGKSDQFQKCITFAPPTTGQMSHFRFGIGLDVNRGRVAFIDVLRMKVMCKRDINFTREVFPMFCINPKDDNFETKMKLVIGQKISIGDRKFSLMQEALSD